MGVDKGATVSSTKVWRGLSYLMFCIEAPNINYSHSDFAPLRAASLNFMVAAAALTVGAVVRLFD